MLRFLLRFFDKIQPYIPIISQTYFRSIQPSQLLLAAIYGVAARLPGAIVSSRDFTHIKRVLHNQLARLINDYKPSLQACMALCLIHLTIELQCDGIEGVEAWPLRLGMVCNKEKTTVVTFEYLTDHICTGRTNGIRTKAT